MHERLIAKAFGPIKDLDITFQKVTVFIGDQGIGKSCVAKLFSMFKWLEKALTQKKYTPNYFEQHNRFIKKLCAYHRIETFISEESYIRFEGHIYNFTFDKGFSIEETELVPEGVSKIMYIPAERSIVSVAENKPKLLKELPDSSEAFYDEFVNAKKHFQNGFQLPFENLRFEYDALNDASWICGENYKVRILNASSGIQSALPMCIVTEYLTQKITNKEENKLSKEEKDKLEKRVAEIMSMDVAETIKDMMIRQLSAMSVYNSLINIVEEPELSLFPTSQMHVLFSIIANNTAASNNMLVLTTHSPYSLAIINLMIMGGKAFKHATETTQKDILKILPPKYHLDPNDVAVYRLDHTSEQYCLPVINTSTGLIAKNTLDAASHQIMDTFNNLYCIYANILQQTNS